MPFFHFISKSENETDLLVADILKKRAEDGNKSSSTSFSLTTHGDQILENLKSDYEKLPVQIKNCFEYCCIRIRYSIEKEKLVRLLLAEGLVQETPGEIMEDTAAKIITQLVGLRMVREENNCLTAVSSLHRKWSAIKSERQDLVDNAANSPLILCSVVDVCGFRFLLVLDIDGEVDYLADEIGDLIHLRYLGLENSELNELPGSLGNLQKLQTLDIRMCWKLHKLPIEVLKIHKLRHLLMSRCIDDGEIIVPKGIGKLTNLHTCTGVYAGDGIATELGTLPQLKELGIKRVDNDQADELYAAITKMESLISLSLEAEEAYCEEEELSISLFSELELLSPPPLLRELTLHGGLIEIPAWLASMSNLTNLTLSFSHLLGSPSSVFQFLPKLKHLSLWNAYRGRQIGKEFCQAGGFPELETLTIASHFLMEWNEIEDGAFPKLKILSFRNCLELRFIPEGMQNISTLKELESCPMHEDLAWRLINQENYKIQNITKLTASSRKIKKLPTCSYVGNPKDVLLRI